MAWVYQPQRLRDTLEAAGFDVDTSAATLGAGGSLSARRQRGDRATVVSVDAGGRFLATITAVVDTPPATTVNVEGVLLRVVPELTRTTTISGNLTDPDHLRSLLEMLPSLATRDTERMDLTQAPPVTPSSPPADGPHSANSRRWWRAWR